MIDRQMQGETIESESGTATRDVYLFWMKTLRDIPVRGMGATV